MVDISVITLNYKEAQLTLSCIKSVLKSKNTSFEIIVIDNSTDSAQAKILQKINDKRVRVFIAETNLGCAAGYNYGIKKSFGKYIFIINNDTEIRDSNSLSILKKYMDHNEEVGAVQPKIKSLLKPSYLEYAGASGGYIDIYGYPFCRGRIFQHVERDYRQYENIVPISWASTCAFFARKKIIEKLGYFDPIYFAYAEEIDMSMKIWNSGYQVMVVPAATIYHRGESAWKKIKARKTFYLHRNHLILYFKCFKTHEILFLFPLRIVYELISMAYYVYLGSPNLVFPVLQSYVAVFLLLPTIFKRRKKFFKNYKKNSMPIYNRSIIVASFLGHENKFSKLNKKRIYNKYFFNNYTLNSQKRI